MHFPGRADELPAGPFGAVLSGYLQTRPDAQLRFGRPNVPSPHVSPSFAPSDAAAGAVAPVAGAVESVAGGGVEGEAAVGLAVGVASLVGACGEGDELQPVSATSAGSVIIDTRGASFIAT